ncbi:hypothetical protein F441_04671 [Phytophthora nicotianae CJ01A1]|uniref:SET domain-containing protein n=3 Tax=Phytophthora nicotianae TaxID=4792 RepID=W2ZRA0_PHYNI|nr:hypothetical protein L915_04563 [Phytophthora nicotianae]ETP21919.1 hypothetical protein F441_04671 [Phytophthora nicotianae CJ01A1]ETP49818.1 hypothetical protein F442_04738 [Phytophthora nicotianae P10297]ETL45383.1 hypothetical protein L916_04519 [Phytophthora nicotianae]ETL98562.1 hypothetical protein L917_04398 [Phytophthora nicotianae]
MQRGIHADLSLERRPGKGIALVAAERFEEDALVFQYVGEVLSQAAYLHQELKDGHRSAHTYGIAATTSEVIDASYVGGMARFANHSCSPNCTIERWEVAGETCCGKFAKQTIHAGEEITIRYGKSFVLPEKEKLCLCGSSNCTGFM